MPSLTRRNWVPEPSENYVQSLAKFASDQTAGIITKEISRLTALNEVGIDLCLHGATRVHDRSPSQGMATRASAGKSTLA